MNALEIVAIVILCVFGVSNVLLWAQTTILFDKLFNQHSEKEKNSTAEKMAEYIKNSPCDCCSECCADFERCEAELKKLSQANQEVDYKPPLPPKSHCIANIIKYFEALK